MSPEDTRVLVDGHKAPRGPARSRPFIERLHHCTQMQPAARQDDLLRAFLAQPQIPLIHD